MTICSVKGVIRISKTAHCTVTVGKAVGQYTIQVPSCGKSAHEAAGSVVNTQRKRHNIRRKTKVDLTAYKWCELCSP